MFGFGFLLFSCNISRDQVGVKDTCVVLGIAEVNSRKHS